MTAPIQTPLYTIDHIDGEWSVVRGAGVTERVVARHASEEAARVDARRRNAEHAAATGEPESPVVDPVVTTDERQAAAELLPEPVQAPGVQWAEPGTPA